MQKIRVKEMKIHNFRGIKKLELKPEEINKISGKNETKKTTIAHAYYWAITNTNMLGDTRFQVNPLDSENNEVFGVIPTVEIDFGNFSIKKEQKERWSRPTKEQTEKKFQGFTNKYYFDGEAMNESNFKKKMEEIFGNDQNFRILSNPFYFCEKISFDKRKSLIFEMAGNPKEDEIFDKKPEFKFLKDEKDKNELKITLKSRLSREKQAKNDNKVRLDEVKRAAPEDVDIDGLKKLNKKKEDIEIQIKKVNESFETIENEAFKKIKDLKSRKMNIATNNDSGDKDKYRSFKDCEKQHDIESNNLKGLSANLFNLGRAITEEDDNRKLLGQTYIELKNSVENIKNSSVKDQKCSLCGKPYTKKELESERDNIVKKENQRLDEVKNQGFDSKKKIDELKSRKQNLKKDIADLELKVNKLNKEKDSLLKIYQDSIIKVDNSKTIEEIDQSILQEKEKLENYEERKDKKYRELDDLRKEVMDKISIIEGYKTNLKRIDELFFDIEKNNENIEKLKEKLEILNQFMIYKSDFFEEKINSMFKITKWKLFKENLNGTVEEVCEPMFEGIPYAELSTGRKNIIGMDIVNSISNYLEISTPLWVDNFESVTIDIDKHNSQLFLMKAVEGQNKLNIESTGGKSKTKSSKKGNQEIPF